MAVAPRYLLALLAGCCLSILGGCALPETRPFPSGQGPTTAQSELDRDMVQMDVALLERPLGDAFLNQEIWKSMDEFIVEVDRKAAVEDNGFRVGQIVGMSPGKLVSLLQSERSCINQRRRLLASGNLATNHLGLILPQCTFSIQQNGTTKEITVDQAQFCLDVVPTLEKDGRTRLQITPKVQHGQQAFPIRVAPDFSGWETQVDRPNQSFPQLGWQITLTPGEFLVIGASLDKPGTFAHRALVQEDGTNPVQRVLVMRTSRSLNGAERGEPTLEDVARSSQSPPLALQAALTAVRAKGQ